MAFNMPPTDREPTRAEVSRVMQALIEFEISRSQAAGWAESFMETETRDEAVSDGLFSLVAAGEDIPLAWDTDGPLVPMFGRNEVQYWKDLLDNRPPPPEEVRYVLSRMHSKTTSHRWAGSWAREWLDRPNLDPYVRFVFTRLAQRENTGPLWSESELVRLLKYDQTL